MSVRDRTLWLGGAQWAGKTSVARLLAVRHPLVLYAYDYHDARSHATRALAEPDRFPHRHAFMAALERNPDEVWVEPTPEAMAEAALQSFDERFAMALEDIGAVPAGATVLAEGWGLRPALVAPLLDSPRRAIFLVPSDEFVEYQVRTMARARGLDPGLGLSDPGRAQRNRLARDRLLARDVVVSAERLGLRVVMVDGGAGVEEITALVEEHFRPFLPRWLY